MNTIITLYIDSSTLTRINTELILQSKKYYINIEETALFREILGDSFRLDKKMSFKISDIIISELDDLFELMKIGLITANDISFVVYGELTWWKKLLLKIMK